MQLSAISTISLSTKQPSIGEFIPCNIAGIEATVLEGEDHTRTSQMTEQVIEGGSVINDHVILKPISVTVRFEQCNILYGKTDVLQVQTQEELANISASYSNGAYFELQRVYFKLEKMWKDKQIVSLDTFHKSYVDMILTSLSGMHRAPYKGTMKFTATFTQVNVVKSQFTSIPDKEMSNRAQSKEKKAGILPSKELSEEEIAQLPAIGGV